MGFGKLSVILEPHKEQFNPGDEVSGYVLLVAKTAAFCAELLVTASGGSSASVTEKAASASTDNLGDEDYFNYNIYTWTADEEETQGKLEEGDHTFPFKFILPENIPSSYDSFYGRVRYTIKANVVIPHSINKKAKLVLNIVNPYDLNSDFQAWEAINIDGEAVIPCDPCLCFQGGAATLNINAEHSGYIPGDVIPLTGRIQNHGPCGVISATAKLVQRRRYTTADKTKLELETISKVKGRNIRNGQTDEWDNKSLTIPTNILVRMNNCKHIEVDHLLLIKLKLGYGVSEEYSAPVVIGTIPLTPGGQTIIQTETPETIAADVIGDNHSKSLESSVGDIQLEERDSEQPNRDTRDSEQQFDQNGFNSEPSEMTNLLVDQRGGNSDPLDSPVTNIAEGTNNSNILITNNIEESLNADRLVTNDNETSNSAGSPVTNSTDITSNTEVTNNIDNNLTNNTEEMSNTENVVAAENVFNDMTDQTECKDSVR